MRPSVIVYQRFYEVRLDGVWFRTGPDGCERLAHEPPQYAELLGRALARTTPALALYRSANGGYCCLLNQLHTGRALSGAPSCRSLLLVSRDGFSGAMLRLAALYLSTATTDLRWMRIEFERPQSICTPCVAAAWAPLLAPATVLDSQVSIDWPQWMGAVAALPMPRAAASRDRLPPGLHDDTPDIRARLAGELTQLEAAAGEIVAVVTSGASDDKLRALSARWVLRPEPPPAEADDRTATATVEEADLSRQLAAIDRRVSEMRRAVARLETLTIATGAIAALALVGHLLARLGR